MPTTNIKIHFLNVGHGDCTIIDFPDRLTVVDINNCKTLAEPTRAELRKRYAATWQSVLGGPRYADTQVDKDQGRLVDPIDYLKMHFPGRPIFRYVQSHPDMDHMGGLYRMGQDGMIINNFWDTDNSISKDMEMKSWAQVNHDEKDWDRYQDFHAGKFSDCKLLKLRRGANAQFYADDGISIWAPFENEKAHDPDADPNYFSYVLQIQHGDCSIVLGGDLPSEMWDKLLERNKGILPKVHLLKASHHGRKSGYSLNAVKAMAPDITICSVGELRRKDDAAASYERFSSHGCFSTIDHGTIVATCWSDGDVWLENGEGIPIARTRYPMPS